MFKPVYRDYLWGGDRIRQLYNRTEAPAVCAESWEVSVRPEGMSLVENEPFTGQSLTELSRQYGKELLGSECETSEFPLLIKLIDARETLSIQVHPDEEAAELYGGDPKTEMWHILESEPESLLYVGFRRKMDGRRFANMLAKQKTGKLLRTIPAVAGKSIFVPGGTVHAIGAGNLILEIQQNSNTTYRIYDWERVAENGQPRELHLNQALNVIDWNAPEAVLQGRNPLPADNHANRRWQMLRSDFFTLTSLALMQPERISLDGTTFHVLFAARGTARIGWGSGSGRELLIPQGRSCLVPANLGEYVLSTLAEGESAQVLTTSL